MISTIPLLATSSISFKLIICIVCSLKNSQYFCMQYLPLYTSYFISMVLSDDIIDIEKPDGICSPTWLLMNFQDY